MAALSARRNSEYHSYLGALRPLKAGDARPPPPPVDELIGQSYPIGYLQQRFDYPIRALVRVIRLEVQ
jgi:hypothetical protein